MTTKRGGNDTREAVRDLALAGIKPPRIAYLLGVSRQAVHQHLASLRRDGELPELEEASA